MKDHHHRQHFLQLLCCCFYFSFLYFPFGGVIHPTTTNHRWRMYGFWGAGIKRRFVYFVLFYIKNSFFTFFLHSGLGDFFWEVFMFGSFSVLVSLGELWRLFVWFWQLGGLIFIAYCLFLVYILSFLLLFTHSLFFFYFICVVSSPPHRRQTYLPTLTFISLPFVLALFLSFGFPDRIYKCVYSKQRGYIGWRGAGTGICEILYLGGGFFWGNQPYYCVDLHFLFFIF